MMGILYALVFVLVLSGAGAALRGAVCRGCVWGDTAKAPVGVLPLGWGWSFLVGTAALGAFLYLPLALTGGISHLAFAMGFVLCATLTGIHLWRSRPDFFNPSIWRPLWITNLPAWARWPIVFVLVGAALSSASTRLIGFDGRAIFAMKAQLLYSEGNLRGEDFQDIDRMNFNAHYPLLVSLLEAELFWMQGSVGDEHVRIVFFAYIVAMASVVARYIQQFETGTVAAIATGLLLCVPVVIQTNEGAGLTGSVDLPLACYTTAGILAAAAWMKHRLPQDAIFAGLLLGAAALTKPEGIVWIAAVAAGVLIVVAARPRELNRGIVRCSLAGAILLGCIVALQFIVANRIPFSPYLRSYLAALQWDWLRQLGARPWQVATFGLADCLRVIVWNFTWPCLFAVMLLRRRHPASSEIWLLRLTAAFVAVAYFAVFVITPYHVYWQIATALHRLVLQLLPIAWLVGVEQLSASGWIEKFVHAWNDSKNPKVQGPASDSSGGNHSSNQPSIVWPLRRAG